MPYTHAGVFGDDNFVDAAGVPIPAGTAVAVYNAGTSVLATLYSDRNKTPATNPRTIGVDGNFRFFADPGDYDLLVNGKTLHVVATPMPLDTLPGTSTNTGIDADAVAAMLQGTTPVQVSYSDESTGGTGLVTIKLAQLTGADIDDTTLPVYNGDGSLPGGDGTDPPAAGTFATHAYVDRGDDIVMTIRDWRYLAESVQIALVDHTPVNLVLPPSTVLGRGPSGDVRAVPWSSVGGGAGSDRIQIFWDSGDLSLLGTQIPFSWLGGADTVPATGWTKTIATSGPQGSGVGTMTGTPRLRLSCPTGTVGGSGTRICVPLVGRDSADSEIRSLWHGRSNLTVQMGHMHRVATNPVTGKPWGYLLRHNVFYSDDFTILVAAWTTSGTPGTLIEQTGNGSGQSQPIALQRWVTVLASQRVGTTVTLQVVYPHNISVGDLIQPSAGATASPENATVTAVTETSVTYTSATNLTTWDLGFDRLRIVKSMPYWVASRLEGDTLRAKAWLEGTGEPDWSDANYAVRWVITGSTGPPAGTVGSACLYAGHIPNDTAYADFGTVTHVNLD